jgi:hypothetical protein
MIYYTNIGNLDVKKLDSTHDRFERAYYLFKESETL